jgi:L-amino acid N-acyltransferase YncA
MVLKTLAAAPEARAAGIGAHLADELHARSAHRGYRTMVHALMHDDNASLRLSRRYDSTLLRRYALLEWSPG